MWVGQIREIDLPTCCLQDWYASVQGLRGLRCEDPCVLSKHNGLFACRLIYFHWNLSAMWASGIIFFHSKLFLSYFYNIIRYWLYNNKLETNPANHICQQWSSSNLYCKANLYKYLTVSKKYWDTFFDECPRTEERLETHLIKTYSLVMSSRIFRILKFKGESSILLCSDVGHFLKFNFVLLFITMSIHCTALRLNVEAIVLRLH